jgi:hypothetical protein
LISSGRRRYGTTDGGRREGFHSIERSSNQLWLCTEGRYGS